jgi:hypothetical protein
MPSEIGQSATYFWIVAVAFKVEIEDILPGPLT